MTVRDTVTDVVVDKLPEGDSDGVGERLTDDVPSLDLLTVVVTDAHNDGEIVADVLPLVRGETDADAHAEGSGVDVPLSEPVPVVELHALTLALREEELQKLGDAVAHGDRDGVMDVERERVTLPLRHVVTVDVREAEVVVVVETHSEGDEDTETLGDEAPLRLNRVDTDAVAHEDMRFVREEEMLGVNVVDAHAEVEKEPGPGDPEGVGDRDALGDSLLLNDALVEAQMVIDEHALALVELDAHVVTLPEGVVTVDAEKLVDAVQAPDADARGVELTHPDPLILALAHAEGEEEGQLLRLAEMLPVGDSDDEPLREGDIVALAQEVVDGLRVDDTLRVPSREALVEAEEHGDVEGVLDCDALLVALRERVGETLVDGENEPEPEELLHTEDEMLILPQLDCDGDSDAAELFDGDPLDDPQRDGAELSDALTESVGVNDGRAERLAHAEDEGLPLVVPQSVGEALDVPESEFVEDARSERDEDVEAVSQLDTLAQRVEDGVTLVEEETLREFVAVGVEDARVVEDSDVLAETVRLGDSDCVGEEEVEPLTDTLVQVVAVEVEMTLLLLLKEGVREGEVDDVCERLADPDREVLADLVGESVAEPERDVLTDLVGERLPLEDAVVEGHLVPERVAVVEGEDFVDTEADTLMLLERDAVVELVARSETVKALLDDGVRVELGLVEEHKVFVKLVVDVTLTLLERDEDIVAHRELEGDVDEHTEMDAL